MCEFCTDSGTCAVCGHVPPEPEIACDWDHAPFQPSETVVLDEAQSVAFRKLLDEVGGFDPRMKPDSFNGEPMRAEVAGAGLNQAAGFV